MGWKEAVAEVGMEKGEVVEPAVRAVVRPWRGAMAGAEVRAMAEEGARAVMTVRVGVIGAGVGSDARAEVEAWVRVVRAEAWGATKWAK